MNMAQIFRRKQTAQISNKASDRLKSITCNQQIVNIYYQVNTNITINKNKERGVRKRSNKTQMLQMTRKAMKLGPVCFVEAVKRAL